MAKAVWRATFNPIFQKALNQFWLNLKPRRTTSLPKITPMHNLISIWWHWQSRQITNLPEQRLLFLVFLFWPLSRAQVAPVAQFWHNDVFPCKYVCAFLYKPAYYHNYCSGSNQILHNDTDCQILLVDGPDMHATALRWQSAAILKRVSKVTGKRPHRLLATTHGSERICPVLTPSNSSWMQLNELNVVTGKVSRLDIISIKI